MSHAPLRGPDRITGRSHATRSMAVGRRAMAATSHPLATETALEILRAGGNAVDAAIAANALLGLVEPTGAGVGGDLFAIVWDAGTKSLVGLNGSGRSPLGLSLETLRGRCEGRIPSLGPLSVSVPGCVDGWFALHGRLGRLPMARLLAPAIGYARDGFALTQVIAHDWERNARVLEPFPNFAETFLPCGRAPREGEVFRNPRLADTLTAIAEGGRDAFYRGEIAHGIADFVAEQGGFLAFEDLAEHGSEWVDPISVSYRGVEVVELPPNGQGITALQMLRILEGFDLAGAEFGSADHLHLLIEAKKLAFEDRARLIADMDFAQAPIEELLSEERTAHMRASIDRSRALERVPVDHQALDAGDTVYLTVADEEGNMVSLIQSNFRGMGSGVVPPGLGFVLQDRGELFDLTPGRANSYAPGKRPFHTIIPAFALRDGQPWMSFGVMGGSFQPQGHVQILLNLLDFGMNLQEAGDAPRLAHYGSSEPTGERATDGGFVSLESAFRTEVVEELQRRGHVLRDRPGGYGGYQAIQRDPRSGVYFGASESRKDGHAAGL